jgi:hypothetical protein
MDKETLRAITKVEDWRSFEAFIHDLYKKNSQVLSIEKNYKAEGISTRLREVDVLVRFGFPPHVLALGVECKYWSSKVDADVVDVAVAKRDDLRLDKFAIITTVGYEAGAAAYAASKGIDLFLVRAPNDDDFGYTGRTVKLTFNAYGSTVENVGVATKVISPMGAPPVAAQQAVARIANIKFTPPGSSDVDHGVDIYRYSMFPTSAGGALIAKGDLVDNLASLIDKERMKHTKALFERRGHTRTAIIRFKSDSCIFVDNGCVVHLDEIRFDIRYFLSVWKLEIDRAATHPLIIENVIQDTITPVRRDASNDTLVMDKTIPT